MRGHFFKFKISPFLNNKAEPINDEMICVYVVKGYVYVAAGGQRHEHVR